jgi:hypothetical protein
VLTGEFVTRREGEDWVFRYGEITSAEVRVTTLHEPVGAWELKPPDCRDCADVSNRSRLRGEVSDGDLILRWGPIRPRVEVEARVIAPCTPMPRCAEWGRRLFVSETFFDRVSTHPVPLEEGSSTSDPVIDPQGSSWVEFTYALQRID